MKNLRVVLIFITALVLSACGSSSSDEKSTEIHQLEIPINTSSEAFVNDRVQIADKEGNIFYVWEGSQDKYPQKLLGARNTATGWEDFVVLTNGSRPIISYQWLVTPSGDVYVAWVDGIKKTNQMHLKLVHYSKQTNTWSPAVLVASYDSVSYEIDPDNYKRLDEILDVKLGLDANEDLVIAWQQRSRLANDSDGSGYISELVNQRYVVGSGLQGSPIVFWNYSKYGITANLVTATRIGDMVQSSDATFISVQKSEDYGVPRGDELLVCASHLCESSNLTKVLGSFDSGLPSKLSINHQNQVFWTKGDAYLRAATIYEPVEGLGKTDKLILSEGSMSSAQSPTIIDGGGVGHFLWLVNDVLYSSQFNAVTGWSTREEIKTSNIPMQSKSIVNAINPEGVLYALWPYKAKSGMNSMILGGYQIYAYSESAGWQGCLTIKNSTNGYALRQYLAFNNVSEPIVVWLASEGAPKLDVKDSTSIYFIKVSRKSS